MVIAEKHKEHRAVQCDKAAQCDSEARMVFLTAQKSSGRNKVKYYQCKSSLNIEVWSKTIYWGSGSGTFLKPTHYNVQAPVLHKWYNRAARLSLSFPLHLYLASKFLPSKG